MHLIPNDQWTGCRLNSLKLYGQPNYLILLTTELSTSTLYHVDPDEQIMYTFHHFTDKGRVIGVESPKRGGYIARMTSPRLNLTTKACLHFDYLVSEGARLDIAFADPNAVLFNRTRWENFVLIYFLIPTIIKDSYVESVSASCALLKQVRVQPLSQVRCSQLK